MHASVYLCDWVWRGVGVQQQGGSQGPWWKRSQAARVLA